MMEKCGIDEGWKEEEEEGVGLKGGGREKGWWCRGTGGSEGGRGAGKE